MLQNFKYSCWDTKKLNWLKSVVELKLLTKIFRAQIIHILPRFDQIKDKIAMFTHFYTHFFFMTKSVRITPLILIIIWNISELWWKHTFLAKKVCKNISSWKTKLSDYYHNICFYRKKYLFWKKASAHVICDTCWNISDVYHNICDVHHNISEIYHFISKKLNISQYQWQVSQYQWKVSKCQWHVSQCLSNRGGGTHSEGACPSPQYFQHRG